MNPASKKRGPSVLAAVIYYQADGQLPQDITLSTNPITGRRCPALRALRR